MRSSTSPRREPGRGAAHGQASDPAAAAPRPLAFPADLAERLPLDRVGAEFVARTRREIAAILAGRDDRLLVVVGPCSIHDPGAARDYAERLASVAWAHAGDLLVVMRAYFEKPRTVAGWKGVVNDPRLDGTFEINEGLHRARQLLLEINRLGLAAGTEFLDPLLGQFYADLIAWGVIGARTVESQIHRQLASGLPMPIGFKNRTDGDVQVAVDAIRAARAGHRFPMLARSGAPAVEVTRGNDRTHIVLRGGTRGPNYAPADVRAAAAALRRHGLPPHVVVDCSHGNSGKDPLRQPAVASALAAQLRSGEPAVVGVMLESNLVGGAQELARRPLVYGQSVTDGCLAWEATVPVLGELAQAVRARRLLIRAQGSGAHEAPSPTRAASDAVAADTARGDKRARLRVLVADDEPLARARLLALLPAEFDVVGEYATGTEALEAIRVHRPDIALLDMQMPGCDGLQVIASLEPDERPAVVFVTAHERFAVDAFGIRAADYVLKPFDRQRLGIALGRAAEFVYARRAGHLDSRAGAAGAPAGA